MNEDNQLRNRRLVLICGVVLVLVVIVIALTSSSHKKAATPIKETSSLNTLNDWLPWQTADYKITYAYDTTTHKFSYQITLYGTLNNPSEYNSYIAQLKQYKQEALRYIQSKGVDPSTLIIQYLPPAAASL